MNVILLSVTRFSLIKGNYLGLAIAIPCLISVGFFNFSISQNNETLSWLLKQNNLISGIAILLIFESILIIFLTIIQIKSYYNLKFPKLWKWISVIPSVQLIIAFIFLQTYCFLKINGYSFKILALILFLCNILILWILTFSTQKLIKKWENRAELQAIIALFQLLMAMFLPLIAKGQKVNFTQISIDYLSIAFLTLLIIVISSIGYFIYKRKNNKIT
ncbi:MAG: hypothetical protein KGV59_05930 [Tenacibaculum sp.]|nr:hypothetical protein [Tenacibaculum sp.]